MHRIRVWDLPIRLFHWALVGAVALSYYTMKTPGAPFVFPVEIHARAGLVVLGLLLFRWGWALAGSRHARVWHFLHRPRAMLNYLRSLRRGSLPPYAGHNPLGGLSVVAMLALLSLLLPLGRLAMQLAKGAAVKPTVLTSLLLMAALSGFLLAACVRSFVQARILTGPARD